MKLENFDIWQSGEHHTSVWNNIPIQFLDDFKSSSNWDNRRYRIVYRGKRLHSPNYTLKAEATAFSIYLRPYNS
jgi:hypothetical protein